MTHTTGTLGRALGALAVAALMMSACGGSDGGDEATDSVPASATVGEEAVDTVAPTTLAPATTAAPAPTTLPPDSPPCGAYAEDSEFPVELCSQGSLVVQAQSALAPFVSDIVIDGLFGPVTERTVREVQGQFGLEMTGTVDQEFIDFLASQDPAAGGDEAPDDAATDDDATDGDDAATDDADVATTDAATDDAESETDDG